MAVYTPVPNTDPNYFVLSKLISRVPTYVVTYLSGFLRVVAGFYKNANVAFNICEGVSSFQPLCFLLTTAGIYFVDNGGRYHP